MLLLRYTHILLGSSLADGSFLKQHWGAGSARTSLSEFQLLEATGEKNAAALRSHRPPVDCMNRMLNHIGLWMFLCFKMLFKIKTNPD